MSHSFDDTDDDYEQPTFFAVLRNEVVNVESEDENIIETLSQWKPFFCILGEQL